MRGPACLLPLLTSNKIKADARFDHLHRRRELTSFIENSLINFNIDESQKLKEASDNNKVMEIEQPKLTHAGLKDSYLQQ